MNRLMNKYSLDTVFLIPTEKKYSKYRKSEKLQSNQQPLIRGIYFSLNYSKTDLHLPKSFVIFATRGVVCRHPILTSRNSFKKLQKLENIYPIFDKMLPRQEKEQKLGQKAKVFWFTGLSGSGKTTLAIQLERHLFARGYFTQLLDGDNIRSGLNANLGFSEEDRKENIRRIAEVSKLFANCGVIVLACFVSPTEEIRRQAKEIIGKDFVEVFVNTPLAICEQRDIKGLYQKARAGIIKDFTGISSPFEAPKNPDIQIETENKTIEKTVQELLTKVEKLIKK